MNISQQEGNMQMTIDFDNSGRHQKPTMSITESDESFDNLHWSETSQSKENTFCRGMN